MTMASSKGAKIYPFLWYAKDAEEAARFYASVFPKSRVNAVTAMQSESPSGPPGSVKVVDFTLLGQKFVAMTAGPHHDFNDAISMVVQCDDQKEVIATGTRSRRTAASPRPAAGSSTGTACGGRSFRRCCSR
jgi:predicted 3-demethylubiquinone-9 3-methyltransferase (glyoxalase superfamily)